MAPDAFGAGAARFFALPRRISADLALGLLGFLVAVADIPAFPMGAISPRWAILALGTAGTLVTVPMRVRHLSPVVACCATTLLWSPDPYAGFDQLVHLTILGMAFLVGAKLGADSFFLGAILGLLPSLAVIVLRIDVGALHPNAGLFYNKNSLGEAAAILACFVSAKYASLLITPPHFYRKLLLPAVPFLAVGLSGSRAAILAVAFVVGRHSRFLFVTGLLIAAGLCWLLPWSAESVTARLIAWRTLAINLTLFGHGLGSVPDVLPVIRHAHNDVLELVYQLGIFAIPLYVVAIVGLTGPGSDALWAFGILALVAFPLQNPLSAALGAVVLGDCVRAHLSLRRSRLVGRNPHDTRLPPPVAASS